MDMTLFPDEFYEKAKPRLHRRIGRELCLAGRVLDIGCGSCDLVQYLAQTYHQDVTGVDISSKSFPRRTRSSKGGRIHCIGKDARHLDFTKDEAIDAVVTMWALHEMSHPLDILSEVWRVLRAGGELLVVDFPKDSLGDRLWNEEYARPGQVAKMLQDTRFNHVTSRLIEKGQILWAKGYRPEARIGGGRG
jgi:ubiquinone/menaquinone biosynthesis C-methylase UbiE